MSTDNPFLVAYAERDLTGRLENIDTLIDQREATALAHKLWEAAEVLDRALDADGVLVHLGLPDSHALFRGAVFVMLGALCNRGAMLLRALDRFRADRLTVYLRDRATYDPDYPLMLTRLGSVFPDLIAAGFFAGRAEAECHLLPPQAMKDRVETAIAEYGRRMTMTPFPVLVSEALLRLPFRLPRRGPAITVSGNNEVIKETLPWLRLRGAGIVQVGGLDGLLARDREVDTESARVLPRFSAGVEPALKVALLETGVVNDYQATVAAQLVITRLADELSRMAAVQPVLERRLREMFPPRQKHRVILNNAWMGHRGRQVFATARRLGILVIGLEHGVTVGLARDNQRRLAILDQSACDRLLVCSDAAAVANMAENAGSARRRHFKAQAVGLADQTRRLLFPRLQRALARRRLGLTARETVVMHVSSILYPGNRSNRLYAPTNSSAFAMESTLINEVYAGLRHCVMYKEYPARRFVFQPGQQALTRADSGVRFVPSEDFRYVRAAADVIVTSAPTSTLGWCAGADVPLVWLDSRLTHPLLDEELHLRFQDSFLYVDTDQPEWPKCLRSLLDCDIADIRADWRARGERRATLLRDCIFGPSGSVGRRTARIIWDELR